MIWTTAKSTDVNSRHRPHPSSGERVRGGARSRARGPRPASRWTGPPRRRRPAAGAPANGLEGRREVVLEVLEVLEPDRHAEQPGGDARVGEIRLGHLSLGGRRRVDDHRVDASERGGQFGQGQRVDDGATGRAATGELDGEHPAGDTGPELARGRRRAGDGSGGRGRGHVARRPDVRATPRVPPRSARAARPGRRASGSRAGRGRHRTGRSSRRCRSGPSRRVG